MSVSALRIGVAGAGNIASIAQLPTLVARDDIELSALVTRKDDPQPLMRRWGFRRAYPTIEAMLSAEGLDALFVLTPRSEHVHATRIALQAGVDVFCEKPLATSASDAQSLAELAAARERVLMVGFNRRFAPVYQAGRAAFGRGGASFCVAQKNRAGSEYRATFENAIHMVDLLHWYCGGEPVDVSAHAAGEDRWQEGGAAALVRFDNGHAGCSWRPATQAAGARSLMHTGTAPARTSSRPTASQSAGLTGRLCTAAAKPNVAVAARCHPRLSAGRRRAARSPTRGRPPGSARSRQPSGCSSDAQSGHSRMRTGCLCRARYVGTVTNVGSPKEREL